MNNAEDPERVAAVRRALDRLIEILAKAVAKELVRRRAVSAPSADIFEPEMLLGEQHDRNAES